MEEPIKDPKHWLKELANQSWNLELLVSGAALFSTSFLPDMVDNFYNHYKHEFSSSSGLFVSLLPMLAHSFAKAASYLLIISFSIHFVMRAFWIGLVGLKAVYPQGIIFENLPNTNTETQNRFRKQFISLDHYILSLDRLCSIVFSIAFLLVLMCIVIANAYVMLFVVLIGVKTYFPGFYPTMKIIIMVIFGLFMTGSLVTYFLMNNKKTKDLSITTQLYNLLLKANSLLLLGMYKPSSYINFVFASNLPQKKYYSRMILFMVVFMVLAMSINLLKQTEEKGMNLLESRVYYSNGTSEYLFDNNHYDNLRQEDDYINTSTIQSDVVEGPFLKLFVNYPKELDHDLLKICASATAPDSLSKYEKRMFKDKKNIECLQQYFQVSVNDSLVNHLKLSFTQKGENKGLISYLSTKDCVLGQNTLKIKTLQPDSLPKKVWTSYDEIVFWFDKK